MEQLISRVIVSILWISLPLLLLFEAPGKFIIFITVIWLFTLYSHICHAFIHSHLITGSQPASNPWINLLKVLIFGPLEIEQLKKRQQISVNNP